MLYIIEFIGEMFLKLYTALDINIFPDLSISYIDMLIGIVLFTLLLKLLFIMSKEANFSIGNSVKSILERNKRDTRK